MSRLLRWAIGLLLVLSLVVAAALVLPFRSWLPGGTVADLPRGEVVNGTAFNRLFPAPGSGEQIVFSQEKRGFSEARLRQGERTLALLAISDTTTAPEARDKFNASQERLEGWPVVDQGPQASALLVAERFQVKVLGQGEGLDPAGRRQLIRGFDLDGLAALAPAAKPRLAAGARGADGPPAEAPALESAASLSLQPVR
jgi:hypothetical protein